MDKQSFHFIGIGGVGMSALARILIQKGHFVSGSDISSNPLIDALMKEGAQVCIGHKVEAIKGVTVVYNSDIKEGNVELKFAKKEGLPLLHRSDLLDQFLRSKEPLLVTGTHGKTTTTALLTSVLIEANKSPSFVVGGIVQSLQTNGTLGLGPYFVAEADESDGSFLKTPSFGAIVTNCENEHMNYWKSGDLLNEGFRAFFSNVKHPEHLFWCRDDARLVSLKPPGFSYGFSKESDVRISNYSQNDRSIVFDIFYQGKEYKSVELSLSGQHNALNGSAVFGLCLSLNVDEKAIRKAFLEFRGVKRRLEWKGEVNGVSCFDDYGHHPTEILATLKALKGRFKEKRLVVVFQPHRFSRMKDLWDDFFFCFLDADVLVVTDIYSAGEAQVEGLYGEKMATQIQSKTGKEVHFLERSCLEEGVAKLLKPQDVVLTIGAGDITKAGELILQQYERK